METREQGDNNGAGERPKTSKTPKHQRPQQLRRSSNGRLRNVPGKTFSDISIAGVSRICSKRCSKGQRWGWGIVLVVCTSLMTAQVWDRVTYYLSMPVSVNVRVTRNQTLRFPIVTFCNKNQFNMTAVGELRKRRASWIREVNASIIRSWDVHELVGTEGLDAMEVWELTKHQREFMIKECFFMRGLKCDEMGTWSTIYTVIGVCYQYRLKGPVVTSGIFNNLYLKFHDSQTEYYNNDQGFKFLIHDPRDHPIIDIRTHGTTLEEGWGKDVRVAVREFKTIPTRRWPCIQNASYSSSQCLSKCFLQALYKRTQCLMPYMTVLLPDIGGRPCNTREEYEHSIDSETNLLFYGGWSPNDCKCLKQCNEDIYSVFMEASVTENTSGKLRVFFQDLTYDEVSEEIAYDAIALLCDIGGTLGLLLGASVLTFIEIVEVFWMKITKL